MSKYTVVQAGKGTESRPWLGRGFLFKTGLLHFLKLHPNFCLEVRTVVAQSDIWNLVSGGCRAFGSLKKGGLHRILMPALIIPIIKTRLLQ